jgi:hypothetical protein
LGWDFDAAAGAIEQQPMIHAADIVALESTHRQRCGAMTAAIHQGNHLSRTLAPEEQRHLCDGPCQHAALWNFVRPSGDIPGILQKRIFGAQG